MSDAIRQAAEERRTLEGHSLRLALQVAKGQMAQCPCYGHLCDTCQASRELFKTFLGHREATPIAVEEDYVAWCRYTEHSIVTCDSDAPGAFKVYRGPRQVPEERSRE